MEITIEEVFNAYYECRKTKRCAKSALEFEVNYEENLIQLYEELKERTWRPGKSQCFIVTKPVRREIFAAPFRDRIVHHILIGRLNTAFEKYFIRDSYACRVGKGTHAAIRKVEHNIKSESNNGHKETYILKLDIKGFFMSIDRNILWQKLESFIDSQYKTDSDNSADFEKYLAKAIIFNNPTQHCIFKSKKAEWEPLPRNKSMFTAQPDCALPIGNLTSQVFANFYLSAFDHYIKHTLKFKRYVRYVDDCVFVSRNIDELKTIIHLSKKFLKDELHLTLHPKKIYLQKAGNGVQFLGTFIKPWYTVSDRRIKNNFVQCLKKYTALAEAHLPNVEEKRQCRASVNSYLGIIAHYKTYTFRKAQIMRYFENRLNAHFFVPLDLKKIVLKRNISALNKG
jgi:hypothetical protein